jgi:hypothetical protein
MRKLILLLKDNEMKCLAGLVLGLVVSTAWAQTPVCPVPGDWQFVPEFRYTT